MNRIQTGETDRSGLYEDAMRIVHRNATWAAGAGLFPLPMLDFSAVTGVNVKMLKELAAQYQLEFQPQLAKSACAALISGSVTQVAAFGPVRAGLLFIPVVGPVLSLAMGSVMGGGITYATGILFIRHFEAGGTFHDFDAGDVRDAFAEQVEKGRAVVSRIVRSARGTSPER